MKPTELLISLMSLLEQNGAVSIPQAAALLGASEDEVYDGLETLTFAYDESDAGRIELGERGCSFARLSACSGMVPRLTLTQTDVLLDALHSCGIGADSPLVTKLMAAKGALRQSSCPSLASAAAGERGDVLTVLADACETGRKLLIEYRGEGDETARLRTIAPRAIVGQDGHRYVVAWCHDAGAKRNFRLDRVRSVHEAPEAGEESACSRSRAATPQRAEVRFNANAAIPSWPGSRAYAQEDGSTIVETKWLGGMWLPKQIAAQMGSAQVIRPVELKEAASAYARSLLAYAS